MNVKGKDQRGNIAKASLVVFSFNAQLKEENDRLKKNNASLKGYKSIFEAIEKILDGNVANQAELLKTFKGLVKDYRSKEKSLQAPCANE